MRTDDRKNEPTRPIHPRRSLRSGRAKAKHRRILRGDPGNPDALHALGMIARAEGRVDHAVQLLLKAADKAPSSPWIRCDLGNALKSVRRFEEATHHHRHVLTLMPDSPEALSNLGSAYRAWGRNDLAVDCFRRAVDNQPDHAELHYNLGNGLIAANRFEEAEIALRCAAELAPNHIGARANLGIAVKEQGRLDDAIAIFRETLAASPEYAAAGYNLGLALLMAGDFTAGWRAYEWRRRLSDFAMRRPGGPAWDGGDLAGRTLLVHAEQGLGDTIQFMRYVKLAARCGGDVIFQCQTPLRALLRRCADLPPVVGEDEPKPHFDVHAPLMSLPHLLGGGPPPAADGGAYMTADPARAAGWAGRLAGPGLRVGIAWQGRPDYRADKRRSVAVAEFAPLAALAGVRPVSLQKGFGADQLESVAWRGSVFEPGAALDADGAFLDTAAIMAGLDLVVTTDTSIAHLAGALGVETWVALAHVPDWRWGMHGETTPWYPGMRLFRQREPGDWAGVFADITGELARRL